MQVSGSSGSMRSGGLRLLPVVFKLLGFKGTAVLVVCLGAYGLFTGNLVNMLSLLGLQQGNVITELAEAVPRICQSRFIYPWHLGTTDEMVQNRACRR